MSIPVCTCRQCGVNEAGGRSYTCYNCRKGLSPVAITEYDIRRLWGAFVNWTLTSDDYHINDRKIFSSKDLEDEKNMNDLTVFSEITS